MAILLLACGSFAYLFGAGCLVFRWVPPGWRGIDLWVFPAIMFSMSVSLLSHFGQVADPHSGYEIVLNFPRFAGYVGWITFAVIGQRQRKALVGVRRR